MVRFDAYTATTHIKALERALRDVAQVDLTTNTLMEDNVRFYVKHGHRIVELTRHSERVTLAPMTKAGGGDA